MVPGHAWLFGSISHAKLQIDIGRVPGLHADRQALQLLHVMPDARRW
jgi:hypothetical protein